jgi:hypothetical protein
MKRSHWNSAASILTTCLARLVEKLIRSLRYVDPVSGEDTPAARTSPAHHGSTPSACFQSPNEYARKRRDETKPYNFLQRMFTATPFADPDSRSPLGALSHLRTSAQPNESESLQPL